MFSHKPHYKEFKKKNPKIGYKIYRGVNDELNHFVIDEMMKGDGRTLNMRNLGKLAIYRWDRNIYLSKKTGKLVGSVNWGETNKLRAEGKIDTKKLIYFSDSFYVGVKWFKGRLSGIKAYKFETSRANGIESINGVKNKLVKLLRGDKLYYLNFPKFVKRYGI